MKNLINVLIGISAVSIIIAIISRLTSEPILGLGPRTMIGLAGILLLFSIALSVKK